MSSLKASASTDSSHLTVFLAELYVPLCYIHEPLYETSVHWIKQRCFDSLSGYVLWASTRVLKDLAQLHTSSTSQLEFFVLLAMVLRTRPDTLIMVSDLLRIRPIWQGQDALLVLVWMMAQVETILVNGDVRVGELIPSTSFQILIKLTFPLSSERVKATERFEAIYPLLKKVALAPRCNSLQEIFELSLKLVVEGNPVLAKEATEIAIWLLTESGEFFEKWEITYKDNLEASVGLLKKLVEEWNDHSRPQPSHDELQARADKYCNVILRRLEPTTTTTVMLLAAAGATAVTAATALILSFR
ncbi:unnamed protein product [Cochlearia groenlandica]